MWFYIYYSTEGVAGCVVLLVGDFACGIQWKEMTEFVGAIIGDEAEVGAGFMDDLDGIGVEFVLWVGYEADTGLTEAVADSVALVDSCDGEWCEAGNVVGFGFELFR